MYYRLPRDAEIRYRVESEGLNEEQRFALAKRIVKEEILPMVDFKKEATIEASRESHEGKLLDWVTNRAKAREQAFLDSNASKLVYGNYPDV